MSEQTNSGPGRATPYPKVVYVPSDYRAPAGWPAPIALVVDRPVTHLTPDEARELAAELYVQADRGAVEQATNGRGQPREVTPRLEDE